MKNSILGSLIVLALIFVSLSSFSNKSENDSRTQPNVEVLQHKLNSIDYRLNFKSILDLKKFDVNQISTKFTVSSCTACINISVVGNGGSLCATAPTCKEALAMLKKAME